MNNQIRVFRFPCFVVVDKAFSQNFPVNIRYLFLLWTTLCKRGKSIASKDCAVHSTELFCCFVWFFSRYEIWWWASAYNVSKSIHFFILLHKKCQLYQRCFLLSLVFHSFHFHYRLKMNKGTWLLCALLLFSVKLAMKHANKYYLSRTRIFFPYFIMYSYLALVDFRT